MANDNLIQKVINELNYEIIQLKYKNETNVTMRIDTIIEFLEGVKDDVIGARDNQKFDLHRTATNCVITILDEDNDPITDGSNKLTYGDVIKISVVASAGYENPTISVNGLPFTSGNTMVVKTDLNIVGSATAIPIPLTPFEVDDEYGLGSKIHFNTSKGSELATYLAGLTYQDGEALLIGGTSDFAILAFDMSVTVGGSGYLVMTTIGDGTALYASEAGSQDGLSWSAGFQNLDANGDIALTSDTTIEVINDTTPPSWNGVIIGIGEIVAPAEPEDDNSFEVGDVLANGDRIQFDTTKSSELTTFLRSLDYTENNALIEQGILPLMKGEGTGGSGVWILGIMPTQTENNDALLFMFTLEGVFNVIYSTFAMENPENPSVSVVEGWNNGVDLTGYITLNETEDTTGYVPDNALPITVTAINYSSSWNGVIVSKGA